MAKRFVIYGLLGWTMEILWTGLGSLLKGNLMLSSFTYLWMFPIYGLAVFLEPVHDEIDNLPWYLRGGIWVIIILSLEYLTGWILMSFLGRCPWDYRQVTPYHLQGLIRLDYIPAWFLAGLVFEKIHRTLDKLVL
ncbi:MAG TPA: hypothetical protein GX532_02615 [Clostridia bacterium]|jgi:uncharacterized membrane protein|nr:hypothetical protein [Clostridia bacterium]HHY05856.1 hypothetical protein [Clostridia bacterium]